MVARLQGDLTNDEKKQLLRAQQSARADRYAMQSVVKEILPNERVTICLRNMVRKSVEVHKHRKTEKAFYSGLMICGSVWLCPVCAAKISERRKKELTRATSAHKASGGQMAMLTLTVSHKSSDMLQELLTAFNDAVEKMFKKKEFTQIRQEMGIIGRVKVLEVTHGVNGWHPHAHIVLFYEHEVDISVISRRMYKLWSSACAKYELKTSQRHGLSLQGADHVQAYLTKQGSWSIEQEMTKSHIKKGRAGSMTPFDLLRDVLESDDEVAKQLFIEYAKAFKGKRQLHWSRGLKAHFDVEEKTDEQLSKEQTEHADVLGSLDAGTWRNLYRNGLRAQLLTYCERFGFDKALELLLNEL